MEKCAVPEIRIGLIRFVGQEALRSQRWAITALLLAKAIFWISVALLLWLNALKAEPLHVVYRPNDGVQCSGILCSLLKLPLVSGLIRAGPLHL